MAVWKSLHKSPRKCVLVELSQFELESELSELLMHRRLAFIDTIGSALELQFDIKNDKTQYETKLARLEGRPQRFEVKTVVKT